MQPYGHLSYRNHDNLKHWPVHVWLLAGFILSCDKLLSYDCMLRAFSCCDRLEQASKRWNVRVRRKKWMGLVDMWIERGRLSQQLSHHCLCRDAIISHHTDSQPLWPGVQARPKDEWFFPLQEILDEEVRWCIKARVEISQQCMESWSWIAVRSSFAPQLHSLSTAPQPVLLHSCFCSTAWMNTNHLLRQTSACKVKRWMRMAIVWTRDSVVCETRRTGRMQNQLNVATATKTVGAYDKRYVAIEALVLWFYV